MSKKSHPSTGTPQAAHPDHDEFMVVPAGRSKRQFLLTFGLMIFVLLIFTVGDAFQDALTGGGGGSDKALVRWTDPMTSEEHEVRAAEFYETGDLLRTLARVGIFQPWHGEPRKGPESEDVALFLILEQLAKNGGIALSTEEFKAELIMTFAGPPQPDADPASRRALASERLKIQRDRSRLRKGFEAGIRRVWTVHKLQRLMHLGMGEIAFDSLVRDVPDPQLLQFGYGLPNRGAVGGTDAARVAAAWDEAHVQYRFDYLQLAAADFADAAREALPDTEALTAWFHERPMADQREHYTEQEYKLQVAYVPLDAAAESFDGAALLEAHPAPEGFDPEGSVQAYYTRAREVRFKIPAEEMAEDPPGEDSEDDPGSPAEEATEEVIEEEATEEEATEEEVIEEEVIEDAVIEDAVILDADLLQPPPPEDPPEEEEEEVEEEVSEDQDEVSEDQDEVSEDQDEVIEEEVSEDEAQDPPAPRYRTLEEVREQCERESDLHRALGIWRTELQEIANDASVEPVDGEDPPPALDFAAEAAKYGLELITTESMTRDEIAEQPWAGTYVGQSLQFRPQGARFLNYVVIEEHGLVLIYVDEVIEPREPEFAEIQDVVAEEWIAANSIDLAEDALEELRGAFGTRPEDDPATEDVDENATWIASATDEAFRAAGDALGYEVHEREWLEQSEVSTGEVETMTSVDRIFRAERPWFDLEADGVPAPALTPVTFGDEDEDDRSVILVRYIGERPKPIEEMEADDLINSRKRALDSALTALDESFLRLDSEWFKRTFKVHLDAWDRRAEAEAKEQAGESSE